MKALFVFCCILFNCLSVIAQTKVDDAKLLELYQTQHYAEAATYLNNVYPEPITDLKALARLAYTYQMAGKMNEALSYYQRIYQKDSTNVGVLFNLANINLRHEYTLKALEFFNKIAVLDSLNFNVYKQLGQLYADKVDTVNALKNLQKANKINPDDPDVASQLCAFYAFKKKNTEAEAVLRRALKADTTNIILLRTLMKLTYSLSHFPETVKTCQALISLGDVGAYLYDKMGSSYFGMKNYECCIETFALLPGINQTERTYYLTAVSYRRLKDYKKAIEFYDLTLQQSISPNTYAYYREMAETNVSQQLPRKATINYQKSLFFDESPQLIYTLATLYDHDLKDKRNALKYYKKYIESKPPAKQQEYITYVQSRIQDLSK